MADEKQVTLTAQQAVNLLQNERAKMQALEEQFLQFRMAWEDTLKAKQTLHAMQKTAANEKMLIPLGAGVFASALLDENEFVHVTLGGSVVKKEKIPEALQKLENRQKEAEEQMNAMQKEIEQTSGTLNRLSQAIQQAQAGNQNKGNFSPTVPATT